MASFPSLTSSTSLSLVSPSQETNSLPLMANLFSVAGRSDMALQEEMGKTSQVLMAFIEQTNGQLQLMGQENAELRASLLASKAEQETTGKMHQAQMLALQQLSETMNQFATQINERMDTLDNRLLATNQRIDQVEAKVAPSVQDHQARVIAAQQQAAAQAALNQIFHRGFRF